MADPKQTAHTPMTDTQILARRIAEKLFGNLCSHPTAEQIIAAELKEREKDIHNAAIELGPEQPINTPRHHQGARLKRKDR